MGTISLESVITAWACPSATARETTEPGPLMKMTRARRLSPNPSLSAAAITSLATLVPALGSDRAMDSSAAMVAPRSAKVATDSAGPPSGVPMPNGLTASLKLWAGVASLSPCAFASTEATTTPAWKGKPAARCSSVAAGVAKVRASRSPWTASNCGASASMAARKPPAHKMSS